MRDELVQECSDRGGCCSRGWNCCDHRADVSTGAKGLETARYGHCTVERWCCINHRGFELSKEMKQRINDNFKARILEDDERFALSAA